MGGSGFWEFLVRRHPLQERGGQVFLVPCGFSSLPSCSFP
jgi:hypothetical protein